MTDQDPTMSDPWWASGRDAAEGLDPSQDPFDAHDAARRDGATADAHDTAGLVADAVDVLGRLAAEAGRRVAGRAAANAAGPHGGAFTRPDPDTAADEPDAGAATSQRPAPGPGPHQDGAVCDACPVCIGLRALRQVRPEVVAHLSDAAHHVSLALRAFAEAQTVDPDGLQKIDLDP